MYSYRMEQAIRAAAVLHKDQERNGVPPLPCITHLTAVAWLVSDYTDDEDTVIAAWLHDTIEDTDYTFKELEEDFGEKVRKIVEAVTEPKEVDGKKLDWLEKKEAYLAQLKSGPKEALIVAAADKIHNLRCIVEQYHEKPTSFMKDFGGSLEQRGVRYQKLSNLFNRLLDNDILSEFNHVYSQYKNFLAQIEESTRASKAK